MDPWTCPLADDTACDWKVALTDPPVALYRGRERTGKLELPLRILELEDGRWELREVHGFDSITTTVGWVAQAAHLKQVHPLDPHVPEPTYLRLMA